MKADNFIVSLCHWQTMVKTDNAHPQSKNLTVLLSVQTNLNQGNQTAQVAFTEILSGYLKAGQGYG